MAKQNQTNNEEQPRVQIIIDASGFILGRLASYAAKQSMLGKKVIIVNCDKALVTGRRRMVILEYLSARTRGGTSLNGPHFPKHSDRLVKRTVRGMLSYTQQRGLNALKRVICHNGVPKEYESSKKINSQREIKTKTITLGDLSSEL